MSYNLYTYSENYKADKILIAAKYVGITITVPKFNVSTDSKTPAFLAKNPLGKVPVLDTPTGPLFESNAILRYVARLRPDAGLYGANSYDAARVDQWIDFAATEIEPPRATWLYTLSGFLPPNQKVVTEAKKDLDVALAALNTTLLHTTFLAGNAVTIADIAVFTSLHSLYAKALSPETQKKYANVLRWFNTIGNQPNVKAVTGEVTFAKAEAALPKPTKEKKEEKAPEAKKEAPAKAEKPAAAAAGGDDYDDDDDKPKLKPKNPLDSLPPSKMDLDTVKKMANWRPFAPDFFEKLWPEFDADGYTWYTCHYKYNDENTVFFKAGNTIGGFIQRSDACRKYAMGVMNLVGNPDEETPPFKICGAWLFRGPGIINEMTSENPDSEYYEWRKIDPKSESDRQAVKDQFLADTLEGEKLLDRRFFK